MVDDPNLRQEQARALARANAMDINDVRIMRLVEAGPRRGQWARAVRALDGRADLRHQPRMLPDGTLGHHGYATDANQDSYVWAVMDRSSQYRVGITLDRDADGIPNVDDNCVSTSNSEQADTDGCSVADHCPCDDAWKNHGAYVRCVARTSDSFVDSGLLTEAQKDAIVSAGAQSACGFKD